MHAISLALSDEFKFQIQTPSFSDCENMDLAVIRAKCQATDIWRDVSAAVAAGSSRPIARQLVRKRKAGVCAFFMETVIMMRMTTLQSASCIGPCSNFWRSISGKGLPVWVPETRCSTQTLFYPEYLCI